MCTGCSGIISYFLIDIPLGLGYTNHSTVRIAGKKGDFIMTVREIADS